MSTYVGGLSSGYFFFFFIFSISECGSKHVHPSNHPLPPHAPFKWRVNWLGVLPITRLLAGLLRQCVPDFRCTVSLPTLPQAASQFG